MKKIIYLIYLLPIFTLAYLFWQNTKPVLEVRCDVGGKTALCGELVPTARVNKIKDGTLIMEEPVYFDVRLPRKYDTVEAEIEYSDFPPKADAPGAQQPDIFEFGIARDEAKKNFDFTAVENKILDNLGWQKISTRGGSASGGKDGLILYQRNPVYKNIADFLVNPPVFGETVIYRADLSSKFGKMPAIGNTVIDFPVRENIKLLVYKRDGAPEVQAGTGIESDFNKTIDDLGGGLWRIVLSGSKEKIFKKISIDSPYVAIADGIKIGELAKQITIFTPGSRILAQTETVSGVQKILTMDIAKPFEQYSASFNDRNVKTIIVPKGNIELGGTLFFLNDKNIFYPRYEAFYPGVDLGKVNFILAKYAPPQAKGDIKIARTIFNITDTPAPGGKLRFIFSLPNAAKGELVKIKSIKLKFTGEGFGIKKIFQKIFNNLTI